MQEHTPGDVITPQTQTTSAAVQPEQKPVTPEPATVAAHQDEPESPKLYHQDYNPQSSDEAISWEADEFILQEKSGAWYGIVIVASVAITALVYILNKDMITAGLVLVALVGLAAFSGRRPKKQQFIVAENGI